MTQEACTEIKRKDAPLCVHRQPHDRRGLHGNQAQGRAAARPQTATQHKRPARKSSARTRRCASTDSHMTKESCTEIKRKDASLHVHRQPHYTKGLHGNQAQGPAAARPQTTTQHKRPARKASARTRTSASTTEASLEGLP